MIDIVYGTIDTVLEELHLMRSLFPPFILFQWAALPFNYSLYIVSTIDLQPGTNDGITYGQTIGKEWRFHILVNHIQPQRKLAQFNSSRIQVNTIDIVRRDEGFHLLQFITILVWLYAPIFQSALTLLLLLVSKIGFSQLVDDLILESCSTHGRL